MMFDHEEQEMLDVVDDNDQVIDQIKRSDMMSLRGTTGRYVRAVDIFIQRPDGDIYLPRRSTEKKLFPGGLDFSASGHLNLGETYEQGCIREVGEETGINADISDLLCIEKVSPAPDVFYFGMLYLLRTNQIPKLSPEHTMGIWVTPEDLKETIANDVPTKHTLITDIPLLLKFLAQND